MSRHRSLFRSIIGFPVRVLSALPKTMLALLVIVGLGLNMLTLISVPTFAALSQLVETVIGDHTVRALAEKREAEMRARIDLADADNAALKGQVAELEARTAKLAAELAETRVVYRGSEKAARDAVAEASEAMSRRVTNAAARNVASMPGEALPFVGIAVVAGATAWEIADACALMTELHELDVAFNPDHAIDGSEVCGIRVPTSEELWQTVRNSPSEGWDAAKDMYEDLPEISMSGTYNWVLGLGQRIYASLGLTGGEGE